MTQATADVAHNPAPRLRPIATRHALLVQPGGCYAGFGAYPAGRQRIFSPRPGSAWLGVLETRDPAHRGRPTRMRKLTLAVLSLFLGCSTDVGDAPPEALCEQGEFSCAGQTVLLCSDGGNAWVSLEVCAPDNLCDPDQGCRPRACVAGQTDCFGYQFQRCRADGLDWEPVAACIDASACDPELGCVPLP